MATFRRPPWGPGCVPGSGGKVGRRLGPGNEGRFLQGIWCGFHGYFMGFPALNGGFQLGKSLNYIVLRGHFTPCHVWFAIYLAILMARYDCNNLSPSSCIKWWYSYHPARHGSTASVVSWVDWVDQLLTLPWSKLPWGYSSVSSNRGGWGFPFSESPREDCRQWRF